MIRSTHGTTALGAVVVLGTVMLTGATPRRDRPQEPRRHSAQEPHKNKPRAEVQNPLASTVRARLEAAQKNLETLRGISDHPPRGLASVIADAERNVARLERALRMSLGDVSEAPARFRVAEQRLEQARQELLADRQNIEERRAQALKKLEESRRKGDMVLADQQSKKAAELSAQVAQLEKHLARLEAEKADRSAQSKAEYDRVRTLLELQAEKAKRGRQDQGEHGDGGLILKLLAERGLDRKASGESAGSTPLPHPVLLEMRESVQELRTEVYELRRLVRELDDYVRSQKSAH